MQEEIEVQSFGEQENPEGQIQQPKSIKKFVFHLSMENAEIIDGLSKEERNELINSLLDNYVQKDYEEYKVEQHINFAKKIIITLAIVTIGIPLVFFFITKALESNHSNYKFMQMNIQKLYNTRGRY